MIFIIKSSGVEILHTFTGLTEGANPNGGLILDSAGRLWGTTQLNGPGGLFGRGVVFDLTRQGNGTWTETVVHGFANPGDGEQPSSRLVADASGNFFGTTQKGGNHNSGTVFELTRTGGNWQHHLITALRTAKMERLPWAA